MNRFHPELERAILIWNGPNYYFLMRNSSRLLALEVVATGTLFIFTVPGQAASSGNISISDRQFDPRN